MDVNIISIGNSKGIRIPKSVLDQIGLTDTAQLEVKDKKIILSPPKPREGWEEACRKMAKNKADQLLDPEILTEWDDKEWQW